MKLRGYQQAAVNAVYEHLRTHDDNPVAVLPTGAGKSLVLAQIASLCLQCQLPSREWPYRQMIDREFRRSDTDPGFRDPNSAW